MVSLLFAFAIIVFSSVNADIAEERNIISSHDVERSFIPTEAENVVDDINIEESLQNMEDISILAEKSRKEDLSAKNADELQRLTEFLVDLTEKLKDKVNTYKFFNSIGVDRIITTLTGTNYRPLKKQTLILIKTLFNVAPTTTNAFIPLYLIDKLFDIFEKDDSPAMKVHALEIMHAWLLNNPKVQVHVMKLKGLEPFYHQITKLDRTGIHTLIDLFNKIVEEHKNARSDKSQKNKDDYERMQLYQKIGLLERMSTLQVCNGLLNILETLTVSTNHGELLPPSVLGLAKNMNQFCVEKYKGKDKAKKIIDDFLKYVVNWHNTDLLSSAGLDPTEIRAVVEDLLTNLHDDDDDERYEL